MISKMIKNGLEVGSAGNFNAFVLNLTILLNLVASTKTRFTWYYFDQSDPESWAGFIAENKISFV